MRISGCINRMIFTFAERCNLMSSRPLSFLFITFCIFTLLSCGGKEDEGLTTDSTPQINQWTDSIFGTLNGEQQYYQHLIIEIPKYYQLKLDSLTSWIGENQPGAIKFIDWHPDSVSMVKNTLDSFNIIQPFIYTEYFQFLDIPQYPYWEANKRNRDPQLSRIFQKARMNLLDLEYNVNMSRNTIQWLDTLVNEQTIYPITRHYSDKFVKRDYNDFMWSIQRYNYNVVLELSKFDTIRLENFREQTGYEGLFIVQTGTGSINELVSKGADLAFKNIEIPDNYAEWKGSTKEFEKSTKRILDLKSKVDNRIKEQHLEPEITFTQLNLVHNSAVLIQDISKMMPLTSRFNVYSGHGTKLDGKVRKDLGVGFQKTDLSKESLERIVKGKGKKVVILHDSVSTEALKYLNQIDKSTNTLVCFNDLEQYESLKKTPNLLFIPTYKNESNNIFFQQLSKRLDLNGDFVYKDSVIPGLDHQKTHLARTIPEYKGFDPDTLSGINWMVKNAMNGRAFPGCQVLLAKDGCIIFDRQFGHHSYKREKVVTDESIYDLASITKVMATTLMGMKLWEMGKYELQDSLHEYISDTIRQYLPYPSTIRNITFHELLIHKSGLPAGFPLIRYLDYKNEDIGAYDKYYCDVSDSTYCIEVADNFYMDREYADSMWIKLNLMWLDKSKPYKYSDVNMNTMYYMLKTMIDNDPRAFGFTEPAKKLEGRNLYTEYLYKTFYEPLGMTRTMFKPLEKYAPLTLVPTENETFWRGQLLRGYVHDPNAALMGGVAGNAGLFSTTNDMAKLCQMWLDKGVYGGKRYLNAETVTKFTSVAEDSHRGLGFNKRTISTTGFGMSDSCSIATYGHTGFTGTCFWIDPEEGLVYIFLSNRVHPKVNNRIYQFGIRKRIHNAAYDARLNY